MDALDYVRKIRDLQFEQFEGRISYRQYEDRVDWLWTRIEKDGLTQQVNDELERQRNQRQVSA